jgi:hypothetical protein
MSSTPIGEMTRRQVVLEIQRLWPTLDVEQQNRVLCEMDETANQMGLPKGKLPGRATLSLIRIVKEERQPALVQSALL